MNSFLHDVVPHYIYRDKFAHQLGFIEAIEKLYDISDNLPPLHNRVKIVIAEIERIYEHLKWFYEVFYHSGIYIFNIISNLILKLQLILSQFFNISKNNIFSCLDVGKITIEWNSNKNNRLLKKIESIIEDYSYLREDILSNQKLKNLLFAVGLMNTTAVIKTGTVGPIARASAVDHDLRIDDPYWDYLSFGGMKIAQTYDQDIYGLVKVLLNEISVSLNLLQTILQDDFNPISGNVSEEADMSHSGQLSVRLETSKGPTVYSIEFGENKTVNGFGLSTPGMVNLYSLEIRLKGVPVSHINRIIHAYNITELTLINSKSE
jgi:Ni,Fe-hydrogenase III large subunit